LPGLAIGLKYLDGEALTQGIDKLSDAITRLSAYEGKRFGRPPLLLGSPDEIAEARERLQQRTMASPEARDEAEALECHDLALSHLIDLFSGIASRFATQLLAGNVKNRDGRSEQSTTLTPPKVAKRLGVSSDKVYAWIRRGELAAVNAATISSGRRRWLITEDALTEFQNSRKSRKPPVTKPKRRQSQSGVDEYF
jgi:excisionase family DNA binding protein